MPDMGGVLIGLQAFLGFTNVLGNGNLLCNSQLHEKIRFAFKQQQDLALGHEAHAASELGVTSCVVFVQKQLASRRLLKKSVAEWFHPAPFHISAESCHVRFFNKTQARISNSCAAKNNFVPTRKQII